MGYWHNFDNGTGFIQLRNVPPAYDIINVAFADASGANISFTPFSETPAQFSSDIAFLHGQGKKVLMSIGGANETVTLNNSGDVTTFVNSVAAVLPDMLARRRGQLVAISSLASYRGLPKSGAYSASKAAVSTLFESLRVDLRRR